MADAAAARFRPCIDLRGGRVVQIVGGSLADGVEPTTNFTTDANAAEFAARYRADELPGGHVIALGPGNEAAARQALQAYPGGMQMGGGITPETARGYLDAGASHVIVTSYVFVDGALDEQRLAALVRSVGRERLVLDLSCRRRGADYWVVCDRWQRFTTLQVTVSTLRRLADACAEFLVHGVDVEGLRAGFETPLVALLGEHSPLPVTYAGGLRSLTDLDEVERLGGGRVDASIGSALDLFGGGLSYAAVCAWHRGRHPATAGTRSDAS